MKSRGVRRESSSVKGQRISRSMPLAAMASLSFGQSGEAGYLRAGPQHLRRRRPEDDDGGLPVIGARPRRNGFQYVPVPPVYAVEFADGEHSGTIRLKSLRVSAKNLHCVCLSLRLPTPWRGRPFRRASSWIIAKDFDRLPERRRGIHRLQHRKQASLRIVGARELSRAYCAGDRDAHAVHHLCCFLSA